ncbi:acyl carrier protein [Streptomyces ossamyceticus]|uniref:acyl carrier protein n=1 Tax=Streptomyces TaxID=1883 RepID=UPI0006E2E0E4|nr:phosphopantetheine-binding protein [Streptomyces neyagawaensis]MCL6739243.1 phosphopantetheine-binding protein [Streptomyces neyagawaensis]MDE1688839.1 phosphopantetheine-binding protein [Streptomyces neyagawaensis]
MSETYETVLSILVDRFKVDRATATSDSTLADLELDSLFIVEFALTLEDRFGVSISEDALSSSDTLFAVAELVEQRRREAGLAS